VSVALDLSLDVVGDGQRMHYDPSDLALAGVKKVSVVIELTWVVVAKQGGMLDDSSGLALVEADEEGEAHRGSALALVGFG